jgi:two-component system, NarL family, response regulator NreC
VISVLIVDDHELVRAGLRALLDRDPRFQVVGEAGDGQEAIRRVRELEPAVVLLDISLTDGMGGLEAAEAILAERPQPKILVLTQYGDPEYVRRALRLGVHGYLLKRSAAQQLVEAILAVNRGERYLHPAAAQAAVDLLTSGRGLDADDAYETLTPRERQVIQLLAAGRTSREIAAYLGISQKTAMTHREHVMAKLGLHSRAELVRYALRKGIVKDEAAP